LSEWWLEEPLGGRPILPSEWPLTVGGPGAAVVVPGCAPGEVRARVAPTAGGIEVRAEPGAPPDALAGVDIAREEQGGRSVIVVRHGGVANVTRPPQAESRASAGAEAGGDRTAIAVVDYAPRGAKPARKAAPLGWRRPALAAGAVLVLLLLGFLFTATPVEVATSPAADPDHIDFVGTSLDFGIGGRYLVPPGLYVLEVDAAQRIRTCVACGHREVLRDSDAPVPEGRFGRSASSSEDVAPATIRVLSSPRPQLHQDEVPRKKD